MVSKLNPIEFNTKYNKAGFQFAHELTTHPLFALDELVKLARQLPKRDIEQNPTQVGRGSRVIPVNPDDIDAAQVIETIDTAQAWLGLKKIQQIPCYKHLIARLFAPLKVLIEAVEGPTFNHQGFIFITSPHAMVPMHIDPENNFLFQIAGKKTFTLFDKTTHPYHVTRACKEQMYASDNRSISYSNNDTEKGRKIVLEAGDVLHVPVCVPHFVETHATTSISFSLTFDTQRSQMRENAHRFNHRLRNQRLIRLANSNPPAVEKMKASLYSGLHLAYEHLQF